MRKIIFLLLTFISLNTFAQLQVKEGSFKFIPGGVILDKEDYIDDNDQPMALIKISTENINEQERMRLDFTGNLATMILKEYHTGQVYIYISAKAASFLKIMHPDYGTLRYEIPERPLVEYGVYEMVLQYIPIKGLDEDTPIKNNYLIIKSDQPNAQIYIDNEIAGMGEASKLFNLGTTHTYKIECNMYHTETGTVTLNDRTIVNKTLRPAFGYINVSTSPEQGANVFVDGEYVGVSPIRTDKLKSGTHSVRVLKDMYKLTEKTFEVTDGNTTNAVVHMSANFVNITINTDEQSDIYVDEEYKGKGRWSGRLSDGSHIFEARKENHRTVRKEEKLNLGETKTITLDSPAPIYGICDINTTPMGAEIYIDGKHYGQTPNYISDILIGKHELKLTKTGCAALIKQITIEEGKTLGLNETLQTGRNITITSEPSGATVYLDGSYAGTTPLNKDVAFGSHTVKVSKDGVEKSETISVSESGKTSWSFGVSNDKGVINGHEYVDLGLSVKWATCNVGANKPKKYGNYYAWGETKTKIRYNDDNSKTYKESESKLKRSGIIDANNNLTPAYDAARANWGGTWRMPTKDEMQELIDKCTWEWTTQNRVKGYKVTGPNGNSIFLPAAGERDWSFAFLAGECGLYWSSTPDESDTDYAYSLLFNSSDHSMFPYNHRYYGFTVRPVTE